jgi:hypothetical protein
MNLSHPSLIAITRWEVYHRLQELEIPCECATERPLQASITTATAAIQVWSVVRQVTASRRELVTWLEDCWLSVGEIEKL